MAVRCAATRPGMASEPNGEHRHTAATDLRGAVLALNGLAGSQCARKDRLPESLNFSRSLKGTATAQIGLSARPAMGHCSSHADPQDKTDAVTLIEEARHVAGAHRVPYLATRDR